MFLIPRKWSLKQLSSVGPDFLIFNSSVNHIHLAKLWVCEKDGNAKFTIDKLNFDISWQGLLPFDQFVFLGFAVL